MQAMASLPRSRENVRSIPFASENEYCHVKLFFSKQVHRKIYVSPQFGEGNVDNMWTTCGKLGTFPTVIHTVVHIGHPQKMAPTLGFLTLSTFPQSLLLRLLLPYTNLFFFVVVFSLVRARSV